MNLEVGNYYLNGDGRIIKIVKIDKRGYFEDSDRTLYIDNGKEANRYDIKSDRDLISEIPPELHWNLMYNIKNFHTNGNVRKKLRRKYNNYINCCVSKNKETK